MLPRLVQVKFILDAGTRPDDAHLTPEDVDDLRQFIQSGGADPVATRNQPVILARVQLRHGRRRLDQIFDMRLVADRARIRLHRPELEDREGPAAIADAFLAEEDGSLRTDLDRQPNHHADGQPDGRGHQQDTEIEGALPGRQSVRRDGTILFVCLFSVIFHVGQPRGIQHAGEQQNVYLHKSSSGGFPPKPVTFCLGRVIYGCRQAPARGCPGLSNRLQNIRPNCDRRSLIDEIQPQQHRIHPVALFHPTLHAPERARLDADLHALPDIRGEPDFHA